MSTLIAIEDLGIDWTDATTVIHGSTDPDTGGTDVQCPCGWRALIGEAPQPPAWAMPRSITAAREHATTHGAGGICTLIRDTAGEIVHETPAGAA